MIKKYIKWLVLNATSPVGRIVIGLNKNDVISANLPGHSFFGYYDKNPENSNRLIVCHHLSNEDDNSLKICLLNSNLTFIKCITRTSAWNFQQGSRCHWISADEIMLNDVIDGLLFGKVVNVNNGKERLYDYPVHDSCANKDFYITTDFLNTYRFQPEYGYDSARIQNNVFEDEITALGIAVVKLSTQKVIYKKSIQEISYLLHKENASTALINHVMISPSGNSIMFIFREMQGGVRVDSLVYCRCDLSEMRVVLSNTMVSHMAWVTEENVFGYFEYEGYQGFQFIDITTMTISPVEALSVFTDGHPTVGNDDNIFFDTYPNILGIVKLMRYKFEPEGSPDCSSVFKNFHPPKFRDENRCDIHPRFSKFSRSIFMDTIIDGKRSVAKI